jgi:hypothetical protein
MKHQKRIFCGFYTESLRVFNFPIEFSGKFVLSNLFILISCYKCHAITFRGFSDSLFLILEFVVFLFLLIEWKIALMGKVLGY